MSDFTCPRRRRHAPRKHVTCAGDSQSWRICASDLNQPHRPDANVQTEITPTRPFPS
jgi:hypothetical protein